MKKYLFLLSLFVSMPIMAQKNIFHSDEFWKTQPNISVIKGKIAEGNDPVELNQRAFDAVSLAILNNAPNATILYLLSLDGNGVNKITHDKRTYLFWAGRTGNLPIATYLVEKGADVNAIDSHFATPLTFAAGGGNTDTKYYDLLINNGADINYTNEHGANVLLALIPTLDDLSQADYFLKKGLSLQTVDNQGNNAIFYAARNGNEKIIKQLIDKGIDVKAVNKNGENLFFPTAEGARRGSNKLPFFEFVESLGVHPNQPNNNGLTPLFVLSQRNADVDVFQYFIDKKNDINQKDSDGNTPLINASYRAPLEVVTLLAEKSKAIDTQNNQGISALARAVKGNTVEVVNYLLNKGANIHQKDSAGNSLVSALIEGYSPRTAKDTFEKWNILAEKGLDFTQSQNGGNTLYHLAVDKESLELLEKAKKVNVDINAKNNNGLTALQKAVMTAKNLALVQFLSANGADKSVTTNFGETLYDLASENEMLKELDINFLK